MIYYGIAAIFPLIMWFINDYVARVNRLDEEQKKKLKYRLTIIAILPMFLLFVLRDQYIGADTIGYVRFFEKEVRKYSFAELLDQKLMRTEIGYRIYVKIISLFTNNYTVYFLVNGLVILGTLFHFSNKYTKNPFVFFFLFLTLGTYSFVETGLRQALAMAICLWSVDFIKDKKVIPFILAVVLAYYFHKSAILFLVMYPLSLIKKLDWMMAVYIVMAIVLLVGFAVFQGFFNQLLGYEYDVEETDNGGIFMVLILILFAFSFFMMYDKPKEVDGQSLIIQLSLMTVIFWLLRLVSRTAERVSYYYIAGLYIYFSQAVNYDKDKLSSFFKWMLVLACLVLFLYRNIGINYQFFWQGA